MISNKTRSEIKNYLLGVLGDFEEKIQSKLQRPLSSGKIKNKSGIFKPFHNALLPDWVNLATTIERSLSTKLGKTYEKCTEIIAKEKHPIAQKQYRVEGFLTNPEISLIDSIIEEINNNGLRGSYFDYLEQVMQIHKRGGEKRTLIADIFVQTKDNTEYYFEMKTPKANKSQCLDMTRNMLSICAMRKGTANNVKAFFAMPYNPYGNKKNDYNHSIVLNYLDLERQVLMGDEFWEFIGGKSTLKELLSVYEEVGNEFFKEIIRRLREV